MKAHQERMMAIMKVGLEEMKSVEEHREAPKEEAAVETIRAL
jgi:phosphotransferase system HPr-like phosphotransfer protein